jgi:hypothetical protein
MFLQNRQFQSTHMKSVDSSTKAPIYVGDQRLRIEASSMFTPIMSSERFLI